MNSNIKKFARHRSASVDSSGKKSVHLSGFHLKMPDQRPLPGRAQRTATNIPQPGRDQTDYFGKISSELHEPITQTLILLEETLADRGHTLALSHRDRLEVVYRDLLRVLKLAETLEDLSRIESTNGQFADQLLDLAELTGSMAENFRPICAQAGLLLKINCPPLASKISIDPQIWEKIVVDLIANALKFTFAGEIDIDLGERNGLVELKVSDTGCSIPKAEVPNLFNLFYHINSIPSRSPEETGPGLALVAKLVKLYHGKITYENKPNNGSIFTVTIPVERSHLRRANGHAKSRASTTPPLLSPASSRCLEEAWRWVSLEPLPIPTAAAGSKQPAATPTTSNPAPSHHDPQNAPRRILIVDDKPDAAESLALLLSSTGYIVHTAPDGPTALNLTRNLVPDVIFLDIGLPGMSGYDVAKQIRLELGLKKIILVALTGYGRPEDVRRTKDAGFDFHLVKPASYQAFVAILSSPRATL